MNSFFNKTSQVTMNELIDFLDHNQTEITIKVLGQYIKTNIQAKKNNKYLSLFKFSTYEFSNEPITCIFQVKEDRYFFKSFLNNTTVDYTIEVPTEIYELQRRNDYRVSMPLGVFYKCEIIRINELKKNIKTEIRDMSMGGCQISIAGITSDIKQNDELVLYLKVDKFEFQKIAITAKHIKFIESQNTSLIGASLTEPDSELHSELQSMLMYLDRVQRGKTE